MDCSNIPNINNLIIHGCLIIMAFDAHRALKHLKKKIKTIDFNSIPGVLSLLKQN